AADSAGNLIVSDFSNHLIRKVTPAGVVTTIAGLSPAAGSIALVAEGSGSSARFYAPYGIAIDGADTVYLVDEFYNVLFKGYPAPPDQPVVDFQTGTVGLERHFDITNLTATSWQWDIIRRPTPSTAQFSSISAQNPSFIPDAADLYFIRLRATNNA